MHKETRNEIVDFLHRHTWYERRLNLLKALERNARHPIAASVPVDGPLWPEILEWSDMRVAEHEEAVGAAPGMTATWCPRCGDCKCPLNEAGERSLDGSVCPLHAPDSAHGEPAERGPVAVPKRMAGSHQPTLLRQLLTDARSNLEGWAEPNGYLVPSEPDLEERARIRISLRGLITGYMIALGEEPPRSQFEKDDLRDRLRIAEAAVADQEAAARG